MKKLSLAVFAVLALATLMFVYGQAPTQITGAGAPSNPCGTGGQDYVDTTNHVIYHCSVPGQNWVNIGIGSSNTGSLSVSGAVTAGHVATFVNSTTLQDGGAGGTGTVTSVTCGTGLTGGAITTSGTCAVSSPVGVVSAAGKGGFWGGVGLGIIANITSATPVTVNNQVRFAAFTLPVAMTVSKVSVSGGAGTAIVGDVGIYSADGATLLANTGAITYGTSAVTTSALLQGSVTLSPGVYLYAYTATLSSSTVFCSAYNASILLAASTAQIGTAANAATAGVLPSTASGGLGALTKQTANFNLEAAFFEP